MSQRDSGYARIERDCYETPEWVTECLLPHIPDRVEGIWEPAAGSGKMARVLKSARAVYQSDIFPSENLLEIWDFLSNERTCHLRFPAIITNPPYKLATEFIEHALRLVPADIGFVAMLLRTDFDHAKRRAHLFSPESPFAKKIVLRRRIQWFEHSTSSPSFNHAWFIWDRAHVGLPVIVYEPS